MFPALTRILVAISLVGTAAMIPPTDVIPNFSDLTIKTRH